MLGVVIWSAESESKAIIWCEDQGELAFLGQSPHKAASAERFDEGDLIQFDLTEIDNLRHARNPRRIAQHHFCDVSAVISTAGKLKDKMTALPEVSGNSASNVVPFQRELTQTA